MVKKATGVKYTPQEFRLLSQCVECGKASYIKDGEKCIQCEQTNRGHCWLCDCVLREGDTLHYTYDIKDEHRGDSHDFKPNKNFVREFVYIKSNVPSTVEFQCFDCNGWETRKKNKCWDCGIEFDNTVENYKENGNMCESCSIKSIQ